MTESVGAVTIHTSDTVNQVLYILILYGLISFLTLAQSLVDLCPCVEDNS